MLPQISVDAQLQQAAPRYERQLTPGAADQKVDERIGRARAAHLKPSSDPLANRRSGGDQEMAEDAAGPREINNDLNTATAPGNESQQELNNPEQQALNLSDEDFTNLRKLLVEHVSQSFAVSTFYCYCCESHRGRTHEKPMSYLFFSHVELATCLPSINCRGAGQSVATVRFRPRHSKKEIHFWRRRSTRGMLSFHINNPIIFLLKAYLTNSSKLEIYFDYLGIQRIWESHGR